MQTSNDWHLDVQPTGTSVRLVLLAANNTFILSVLFALKAPYTTNNRSKPNSFSFFFSTGLPYILQPSKYHGLIHPCFFLGNDDETFRRYFVFNHRLVIPLKIIIDGKTNPSAAIVRTTVTCLFLEPEVRIVTGLLAVGTNDLLGIIPKNTGVFVHVTN